MASSVKINELPSGNFNAKVFDFTDASGKRHYKSITASSKRDVKLKIADDGLKSKYRSYENYIATQLNAWGLTDIQKKEAVGKLGGICNY